MIPCTLCSPSTVLSQLFSCCISICFISSLRTLLSFDLVSIWEEVCIQLFNFDTLLKSTPFHTITQPVSCHFIIFLLSLVIIRHTRWRVNVAHKSLIMNKSCALRASLMVLMSAGPVLLRPTCNQAPYTPMKKLLSQSKPLKSCRTKKNEWLVRLKQLNPNCSKRLSSAKHRTRVPGSFDLMLNICFNCLRIMFLVERSTS